MIFALLRERLLGSLFNRCVPVAAVVDNGNTYQDVTKQCCCSYRPIICTYKLMFV